MLTIFDYNSIEHRYNKLLQSGGCGIAHSWTFDILQARAYLQYCREMLSPYFRRVVLEQRWQSLQYLQLHIMTCAL